MFRLIDVGVSDMPWYVSEYQMTNVDALSLDLVVLNRTQDVESFKFIILLDVVVENDYQKQIQEINFC